MLMMKTNQNKKQTKKEKRKTSTQPLDQTTVLRVSGTLLRFAFWRAARRLAASDDAEADEAA